MSRAAIQSEKHTLRGFAGLAMIARMLLAGLFDDYHPERHYMRGPGPRWRAKHGGGI